MNDPHLKKRPMIFTISRPLSEEGKVLHDWVFERSRFSHLDEPSGRRESSETGREFVSKYKTAPNFRNSPLCSTWSPYLKAHEALSNLPAVAAGRSPYATENEVFSIRMAPNCPGILWLFPGHDLPRARSCTPGLCHYPSALERCEPDVFLPRRKHYF
jgi:hypothetical protein